jgi:SEFIR domain/NB-ARC domain
MSDSPILSVKTIIQYPQQAQVGRTYVMMIDLQSDEGYEWGYDEEEYPIYCTVDSDIFSSKVVGEPTIIMHRFGGSYGAVKFLLTALPKVGRGEIRVGLINAWGVTVKILKVKQLEIIEAPPLVNNNYSVPISLPVYQTTEDKLSLTSTNQPSKTKSNYPKVLRVFISYSYDSEEHIDRVLALSDRLRRDGIDCNIDQYEQSPPQGWYRWMMNEIERSDVVLMICTLPYIQHFRKGEGDGMGIGVTWTGSIVTQELYTQAGENSKYIPIIFKQEDILYIPNIIRSSTRYNLDKSNGYELLYRYLTKQSMVGDLELSKIHKLSVLDRIQLFTTFPKKSGDQEKRYCNLPRKNNSQFIGRQTETLELFARLSQDYRQHIHVVRGIGGIGKTALVIEVAHQCWNAKKNGDELSNIPFFDAIIFTSSKSTELVNGRILHRPVKEALLVDIFRVISDVLGEPTITQVLPEEQIKKVNEALGKQSTLLIVDSMDTFSEEESSLILSFLNNVPTSTQVIITTRHFIGFDSIQLDSLTATKSYDLLNSQAKNRNITINNNWKRQIHESFSGIPIALIYAIGKIEVGYTFTDIVNPNINISEDLGKFCLESSIELTKRTRAYQLLLSMSLFQNSPSRDALISVTGLTDGDRDTIDGIAQLQQLSLITEKRGRYNTLALTHQYTLSELDKDENNNFKTLARERWYKWYLDFTQQYGGLDWDGWRARYNRLDVEWQNIESVLNWYAEKEEWTKVLQLWQNVDNYADLSGYWQDRRYWWALLGRNFGSKQIQAQALSEKGLTLTLMGSEYYDLAEEYLTRAWDLYQNVDDFVRATVANHQAVLAKVRENYDRSHYWLDIETELLEQCQTDSDREKKRYQTRNLYYRAETNYLIGNIDLAKDGFERTIELTRDIGWQRFRNYAKNMLAEIYIQQNNLELAEILLKAGFSSATQAREIRRIALYQASYARFYYKSAQKARQDGLEEECRKFIDNAKDCAAKALQIFSKEFMIAEKDETIKLIKEIDESWENYP